MEITLYNQVQNPIDAIDRLGEWFAKSGMTGADNSNAGKVLAWECLAQKKSPTQILRRYDIIGGKLRDKALSIYADFKAIGGKVEWLNIGEDGKEANAKFTFEGQTITYRFTIEMATKQGLVKPGSGWAKSPGNMLRARCLSNGIAMLAPGIVAGDELEADPGDSPAPEIKLTGEAKPEPVKTAEIKTIDAEVVPASPEPFPLPPAPYHATSPTPAVVSPAVNAVVAHPIGAAVSTATLLPDELVAQVESAIGAEHAVAAGQWFISNKWIKPGEGLANLSAARANRIIKQRDSFLTAVTGKNMHQPKV